MIVFAAVTALAIAASPGHGAPFGGHLPFPAPRAVEPTEATKCDFGIVLAVEVERGRMRGTTRAGVVTYRVAAEVPVFAPDGSPAAGLAAVAVGSRYRAYYVLDGGARMLELDLE